MLGRHCRFLRAALAALLDPRMREVDLDFTIGKLYRYYKTFYYAN